MKLTTMKEEEYKIIKGRMITDYAKDKVRIGHWPEEEAIDYAKEALKSILKNGMETKGHYFYSLYKEKLEKSVGFVWFNIHNGNAYINNYLIYEEDEDRSLEREMITLVEGRVVENGADNITLHSFGSKNKGLNVFRDLNYDVIDVYMNKKVD